MHQASPIKRNGQTFAITCQTFFLSPYNQVTINYDLHKSTRASSKGNAQRKSTLILKKNYLSWTMMSEPLVGCGAHASATVHRPCVTGTTKGLSIQPSLLNHAWFPTISVKYLWHINKISIQFGATFGHWALTQLQCWQPFLLDFSWRKKDNEMQHMIVLGYQCTNKRSYRNRYRKLKPVIVIYPTVPDSQTRFPKELSSRHQVHSAHKLNADILHCGRSIHSAEAVLRSKCLFIAL